MRLLFFLFLTILFSCGTNSRPTEFDSIQDYQEWVHSESSGYSIIRESGNFDFKLTYLPITVQSTTNKIDTADYQVLKFQFTVLPKSGEDVLRFGIAGQKEFKNRIQNLEYYLDDCFLGLTANDTLRASFVHYENFRGIKNELFVHVHFTLPYNLNKNFKIHFEDKIYNSGAYEYSYKSDLINTPLIINTINND